MNFCFCLFFSRTNTNLSLEQPQVVLTSKSTKFTDSNIRMVFCPRKPKYTLNIHHIHKWGERTEFESADAWYIGKFSSGLCLMIMWLLVRSLYRTGSGGWTDGLMVENEGKVIHICCCWLTEWLVPNCTNPPLVINKILRVVNLSLARQVVVVIRESKQTQCDHHFS